MRTSKFLRLTLLVMGLALTLACTTIIAPTATPTPIPTNTPTPTDTPTPMPSPTPTPIVYDGDWVGTTSQGLDITFTVANNEITSIAIKAKMEGGGCIVTMETTGTFTTPYPIEDGTFTISGGGPDTKHTFIGAFTNPDSASGTLEYVVTGRCGGTIKVDWTATRTAP